MSSEKQSLGDAWKEWLDDGDEALDALGPVEPDMFSLFDVLQLALELGLFGVSGVFGVCGFRIV